MNSNSNNSNSNSTNQVIITPLDKLRKGVRNLVVRARVISKGSVRHLFKEKVMKIEIFDGSLDFSTLVSFMCPDCEEYYNSIEVGKIYTFSRGQIISDQQKGLLRNCLKYEVYDQSYITPSEELPSDQLTLQFHRYEFIKLNQITDKHNMYHFDVLGIVVEEPIKDKQTEANGILLESWKFTIGDETKHTLQISVRNEYGSNIKDIKMFDVILIKSTHINVYNHQKTGDIGSGFLLNPYIPFAIALIRRFELLTRDENEIKKSSVQSSEPVFASDGALIPAKKPQNDSTTMNKEFVQVGNKNISLHYYQVRPINLVVQQVDEQLDRVIRLSNDHLPTSEVFLREFNKQFYFEIEGQIYSASAEKKPYYVACSVCNRKVDGYPMINLCPKRCKESFMVARMTTNFNIADPTGAISAVAFNEQCVDIFGFDGEFMRILDEMQKEGLYYKKDPTYRDFIRMAFNTPFRFRIVSGVSIYEKKYVAKHSIVGCSRISIVNNIQDTASSIETHLKIYPKS